MSNLPKVWVTWPESLHKEGSWARNILLHSPKSLSTVKFPSPCLVPHSSLGSHSILKVEMLPVHAYFGEALALFGHPHSMFWFSLKCWLPLLRPPSTPSWPHYWHRLGAPRGQGLYVVHTHPWHNVYLQVSVWWMTSKDLNRVCGLLCYNFPCWHLLVICVIVNTTHLLSECPLRARPDSTKGFTPDHWSSQGTRRTKWLQGTILVVKKPMLREGKRLVPKATQQLSS